MFNPVISKKGLFRIVIFSLIIVLLNFIGSVFDGKAKLVFCDVDQGDAAYIRTKEKIDILIDAGPDQRVLACLSKYMPFYDRKIEIAILSHPQKDHFGGYLDIVDRYSIGHFITLPLNNNNQSFDLLKRKLHQKKINIKNLYAGEKIILNNKKNQQSSITFLWPSKQYLVKNTNEKNFSGQKNILGAFSTTLDLNDFSLVFVFSQGDFDILFTGDVSPKALNSLGGAINKLPPKKIEILKIPHHGSKNGLTKEFLQLADPQLCVISVGKKNAYGHPSDEILNMLKALKKKYLRTDEKGDIIIEVKKRGWRVK